MVIGNRVFERPEAEKKLFQYIRHFSADATFAQDESLEIHMNLKRCKV